MPEFDLEAFYEKEFAQHLEVAAAARAALRAPFEALLQTCAASLAQGGKLLFFGNGGSAADAQHLAAELTVRYRENRRALAALALTTDSSALTAAGNDFGFEQVFARQIEALGQPGDVAIGISTSGRSRNVILALETAKARGLTAAALGGGDGGGLKGLAEPLLVVPSQETPRIQEMHILLGQMLCAGLERHLGLVEDRR
ncbi:MAG: SIS domain-containing protein [Rhodovibrionaceae bacterium]